MMTSDDMATQSKKIQATRPAHLHRISGDNFIITKEVFRIASLLPDPDELTQRKAFRKVMPRLYVLRKNMGYSFKQITALLVKCGFKLTPSSVRTYYSEFLPGQQSECDAELQEQMLLFEKIQKECNGLEISEIRRKVSEVLERKQTANFG